MAEGARLESVYTLTGIGGSNPSLSAIICAAGPKELLSILRAELPEVFPLWRSEFYSRQARLTTAGGMVSHLPFRLLSFQKSQAAVFMQSAPYCR